MAAGNCPAELNRPDALSEVANTGPDTSSRPPSADESPSGQGRDRLRVRENCGETQSRQVPSPALVADPPARGRVAAVITAAHLAGVGRQVLADEVKGPSRGGYPAARRMRTSPPTRPRAQDALTGRKRGAGRGRGLARISGLPSRRSRRYSSGRR